MDEFTILKFYENPKGTCLSSCSAVHITPQKIRSRLLYPRQERVSFWHIDDSVLENFYGVNICIQSLWTYPGVVSVEVLKSLAHISCEMITWMKDDEVYDILKPFI